jgi:hypothetical protein
MKNRPSDYPELDYLHKTEEEIFDRTDEVYWLDRARNTERDEILEELAENIDLEESDEVETCFIPEKTPEEKINRFKELAEAARLRRAASQRKRSSQNGHFSENIRN